MGPFTDLRFSRLGEDDAANVDSIVHLCQAVGRHMVERGTGSVINVASVAGLAGTPLLAAYGASKAAVISLTQTLAHEWGPSGVRVNALCPGWTMTDLNRDLWADGGADFVRDQAAEALGDGRGDGRADGVPRERRGVYVTGQCPRRRRRPDP